eukprot:tig00000147_g9464.t1
MDPSPGPSSGGHNPFTTKILAPIGEEGESGISSSASPASLGTLSGGAGSRGLPPLSIPARPLRPVGGALPPLGGKSKLDPIGAGPSGPQPGPSSTGKSSPAGTPLSPPKDYESSFDDAIAERERLRKEASEHRAAAQRAKQDEQPAQPPAEADAAGTGVAGDAPKKRFRKPPPSVPPIEGIPKEGGMKERKEVRRRKSVEGDTTPTGADAAAGTGLGADPSTPPEAAPAARSRTRTPSPAPRAPEKEPEEPKSPAKPSKGKEKADDGTPGKPKVRRERSRRKGKEGEGEEAAKSPPEEDDGIYKGASGDEKKEKDKKERRKKKKKKKEGSSSSSSSSSSSEDDKDSPKSAKSGRSGASGTKSDGSRRRKKKHHKKKRAAMSIPGVPEDPEEGLESDDYAKERDGDAVMGNDPFEGTGATPSAPPPVRDRLFIENATTGTFKKVTAERLRAELEAGRTRQRELAEELAADVVGSYKAFMDTVAEVTSVFFVFCQGLFAGISILQLFLNYAVAGWVPFLGFYSPIAPHLGRLNLCLATICLAAAVDKFAKDKMANWYHRPYLRISDASLIGLYVLCVLFCVLNTPADDLFYYANDRVPRWYELEAPDADFNKTLSAWHGLTIARVACCLAAWLLVCVEMRPYLFNLSNRALFIYGNPELREGGKPPSQAEIADLLHAQAAVQAQAQQERAQAARGAGRAASLPGRPVVAISAPGIV